LQQPPAACSPSACGLAGGCSGTDNARQTESESLNNKFDELAKGMAQSVTRRQALKKFGADLAGMALACFGLANRAEAAKCKPNYTACHRNTDCCSGFCYRLPTEFSYRKFGSCFRLSCGNHYPSCDPVLRFLSAGSSETLNGSGRGTEC
jgi:hypothetical protein